MFDQEGNFRARLRHESFDTHITLVGDSQVSYRIHEWAGPPEHADLDVYFQIPRKGDNTSVADSFGGLLFKDGKLQQVAFGDIFSESNDEGNFIKSPGAIVGLYDYDKERKGGFEIGDWEFNKVSTGVKFVAQPQDKPNEVTFLDESGNKVYKLKWEIDQEFALSVSETYLPSQVTKTLHAPVQLNMAAVARGVFARPPYQKEKLGGIDILKIPWTNINQLVRARISYSYPPQKQ